ncbi:MAG TPA: hypothetical protein DF480_02515 [Clostridiales bacterium]|nr:hypothetical protein [Clostridiales bacterium]
MNEYSFNNLFKTPEGPMARNTEQNELLRRQSRERIIDAALHQFSMKGLNATRIQDIAEEAGVSQGLLYRYYASKNEIYVDLIEDALDKMNEAANALLRSALSGKEKLMKAVDTMYQTIETSDRYRQTSSLIAQAMGSEAIPPQAKAALMQKRDFPYQALSQIIAQGQREGTIVPGDTEELAVLFWSLLNGLTIYKNTRTKEIPLPDKMLVAEWFIIKKEQEQRYGI